MLREADIEKINADGEECGEDPGGEKPFDVEPGGFLRTAVFWSGSLHFRNSSRSSIFFASSFDSRYTP